MYEKYVDQYIEDQRFAWSETTLSDERYRLRKVAPLVDGNPKPFWEHLEKSGLGKYTRKTIWTRVTHFWDWLLANGHVQGEANAYREFKRRYARLFKNAYVRTSPALPFNAAVKLIRQQPDAEFRRKALELLYSGCRYTESFTYKDGFVTGKGDKRRAVYMPKIDGPEYTKGYHTFRNSLKAIGLKPHDLRKIWAKRVASKLDQWQLLQAGGWESIETTRSYINTEHDIIEHVKSSVGVF